MVCGVLAISAQVEVEVTLRLTASQPVCQGFEPTLELVPRYYFLPEGCCLKIAVLSLKTPSSRHCCLLFIKQHHSNGVNGIAAILLPWKLCHQTATSLPTSAICGKFPRVSNYCSICTLWYSRVCCKLRI
jgi:hypothetical protein